MYAVVVKATLHDSEKATAFLREQVIPNVGQAPGFVGAQWVRIGGNRGTSMLTFETEEGARAMAEQLKTDPPPADAVPIDSAEIGEVVERI